MIGKQRSELRQRITGAVLVRLLPQERFDLENLSRDAGLSLAAFLRAAALGTPGPRAKRAPTFEAEALAHAVAALNRAVSNLQQIGGILNAGGNAVTQEYFAALAEA